LDEDFETAYSWLWLAHEMKGDYAGAYEWFMRSLKRFDNDSETIELFQKAYETAGWRGIRRKMLEFDKRNEHQPGISAYVTASSSAMLGEKDQAFEYLNKAVEKREWWIIVLNVDPTLDSLRADPRFAELVRRVGLK
jgi:tetratricopeptide (TPR) repeat protein